MMRESFSLKDQLFNPGKVRRISREIQQVYPAFAAEDFAAEVLAEFGRLELKARIIWISHCLKKYLPTDYSHAIEILLRALPPPCDPTRRDDDFGEFIYAPYSEFVSLYGCQAEDLELSLNALKAITTRFSAENAIRPFLNAFPDRCLEVLGDWARDEHYHVRRLASEGTRPTLPWSPRITLAPQAALPLLDQLHADPTRYVTRSVANHLNDLAKIDPEGVLNRLRQWQQAGRQQPQELDFITRHALRSLIKQGHPETLRFLGYPASPPIQLTHFALAAEQVQLGQALRFECEIKAIQATRLVVDYLIHFQNKQGKLKPKVFKLKNLDLVTGQVTKLQKQHPLRVMTTKVLYPGQHLVELQINGQSYAKLAFELMT